MFSNTYFLQNGDILAYFPSVKPSPALLPSPSFPDSSAASQYGQVEEPGPKLDLNLSLYSMAHSESEYDRAEAVTSLSVPPER